MPLKDQLSAYYKNQFKRSDAFYFGITPSILSKSGLNAHPLAFAQDDFVKSTRGKHNIPRRVLNKLSEKIQKPIFSFTAGQQAGIVIDDIDGDGKPVVVAIHGGHNMDRKTESVAPAVLKSERTWTESDYVQKREIAAKEIANAIGVSVKKAKALVWLLSQESKTKCKHYREAYCFAMQRMVKYQ